MAETDSKPARKPHVYDLLGRLNTSFAGVTRTLFDLERVGVFDISMVKNLRRLSKELQANANYHLLETLRDAEQRDWARFGKEK